MFCLGLALCAALLFSTALNHLLRDRFLELRICEFAFQQPFGLSTLAGKALRSSWIFLGLSLFWTGTLDTVFFPHLGTIFAVCIPA